MDAFVLGNGPNTTVVSNDGLLPGSNLVTTIYGLKTA